MRNAPNGSLVTRIPNLSTIYVESLSGTWLHAKYGNYTGYVKAEFILESDAYGTSGGQLPLPGTQFSGRCIKSSGTSIYKAPRTTGTYVTSLPHSAIRNVYTFTAVGTSQEQQEWLYLNTDSDGSYYVKAADIGYFGSTNATISGSGVRLRSYASTSASILHTFSNGDSIYVIGSCGAWKRVACQYGTGWVYGQYVNQN